MEEARAKRQAAGYRVNTRGPDDSTVESTELDLRQLRLTCNSEGIVVSASTG